MTWFHVNEQEMAETNIFMTVASDFMQIKYLGLYMFSSTQELTH